MENVKEIKKPPQNSYETALQHMSIIAHKIKYVKEAAVWKKRYLCTF